MSEQYYIYIITNQYNTVLYTGVSNDLIRRVYEHKEKLIAGFTKKYNVNKLVYYEIFTDINSAITREKQIKAGSRQKKIDLVNSMNPQWCDLYEGFNCSLKIWEILEIWARFTRKIYDVLTKPRPNFHPNELIWTPKS